MKKWIILGIRLILAAVFIYAGIGKILDPAGFTADIENYRLLPYFLSALTAVVLPWIEVICGILLITGKWINGASLIIIILNMVFIIAITSAILRGLDINCGCFSLSKEGSSVSIVRIAEDFLFLGFAIVIFLVNRKSAL